MSLATNALTTVARVKSVLNITDSTHDTHIENMIDAVSQWVEDHCNRKFLGAYATDITEYPDAYGAFIMLKAYPVKSITSIYVDTTLLNYTDDTDGDYRWERGANQGMVQYQNGDWPEKWKAIKVTYKGGYENQGTLPESLVFAVDMLVASIYKEQDSLGNIVSETVGSYSVGYQGASSISERAKKSGLLGIFDAYKQPQVL